MAEEWPYGDSHRTHRGGRHSFGTVRKRDAGPCQPVDIEHMRRCMDNNAYSSLENYAKATWGSDWTVVYANPENQPDFGLSACVVAPVPTLVFDDDHPPCTSQTANSTVIADKDGNVVISYDTGVQGFTTATVVQAAVMPIKTTVTGDISIPALGDHFEPSNVSLTLENFLLAIDSSHKADHDPTSVETRATKGQECYSPLLNVTCSAEGYLKFQIASSGWIWFNYSTPRGTPPDTRTAWAVSIEQVIPDASLRSTYMSVNATTGASRLVAAGDPVCGFTSGATSQTLGGDAHSTSSGTPAYIYVVPIVLGILALGCLGFFLWRRSRRASHVRQQLVEANRAPSVAATVPSISDAPTFSSGDPRYQQWTRKLQGHARADGPSTRYVNEKVPPTYN
ncbi:hypothetical protein AURDEDRAFT_165619 [Auricularia subglabra TFB-10046 SS5]|nr:hypothetical protein AURDEDRAFT_165619 [Auricularia subglabra TFB-10046 SS5]